MDPQGWVVVASTWAVQRDTGEGADPYALLLKSANKKTEDPEAALMAASIRPTHGRWRR